MSVAATWVAMGYLPISARHGNCGNCCKASTATDGIRCTLGRFYVNRTGGCRSFTPTITIHAAASMAPVDGARP